MSEKNLDFKEISSKIKFIDVLNWKNIPFTQKGGELKGEIKGFKFIINIEKNLFFSPNHDTIKGSVINFLSVVEDLGLRQVAKELKSYFLDEPEAPIREMPNLELLYNPFLEKLGISEEIAKQYEIGYVKQRSIMKGRIAFKVYDENGNVEGYVGWHSEKKNWIFPKDFKRPVYNVHNLPECSDIILTSSLIDCLYLISHGFIACASLIARSMTDKQEETLKKFQKILLIHPEPDNIILRLAKYSFVKAPVISKSLLDYTDEEIKAIIGGNFLSKSPG